MDDGGISQEDTSYSSINLQLEAENKILKDTVTQLKNQLDGFKTNPLMVCQVKDVLEKEAVIKFPNGNEFLVNLFELNEKTAEVNPMEEALLESFYKDPVENNM